MILNVIDWGDNHGYSCSLWPQNFLSASNLDGAQSPYLCQGKMKWKLCKKNDWSNFYPFNRSIALWWVAGLVFLVLYTFFKFYVCKPTNLPMPEKENVTLSPVHKVNGTISKGDKELNKTLWSQVNFSVFLKRVENCYIQRPCTNLEHS